MIRCPKVILDDEATLAARSKVELRRDAWIIFLNDWMKVL